MPKDKYLSIFLSQMEAIVFIILQIFFATCGNLAGIGRMCHSVICQSRQSLSVGFQNLHVRFRFRSKAFVRGNSVKDKSKIQVAEKVTGNLTTSREQAKDH